MVRIDLDDDRSLGSYDACGNVLLPTLVALDFKWAAESLVSEFRPPALSFRHHGYAGCIAAADRENESCLTCLH